MKKYHVNDSLEPGECNATKGKCPFGGPEAHFTSFEAAKAKSEQLLEEAHGWSAQREDAPPAEALPLMREISELEHNPALHHYGLAEDEMVRFNIRERIQEKKKELRRLIPHGEFVYNRFVASPGDEELALNQLTGELQNTDSAYSWDYLMGARSRKTAQNLQRYYSLTRVTAKNDPAHAPKLRRLIEQHRAARVFAKTHSAGEKAPQQYEEAFDELWTSGGKMSEKWFREELARTEELEERFKRGEVKPSAVVGTGLKDPRLEATRYFAKHKGELRDAIKTEGRSWSVNVRNVYLRAKRENWPYSRI